MDRKIMVALATKSQRHKEIQERFVHLCVFEPSWQKLCLNTGETLSLDSGRRIIKC